MVFTLAVPIHNYFGTLNSTIPYFAQCLQKSPSADKMRQVELVCVKGSKTKQILQYSIHNYGVHTSCFNTELFLLALCSSVFSTSLQSPSFVPTKKRMRSSFAITMNMFCPRLCTCPPSVGLIRSCFTEMYTLKNNVSDSIFVKWSAFKNIYRYIIFIDTSTTRTFE